MSKVNFFVLCNSSSPVSGGKLQMTCTAILIALLSRSCWDETLPQEKFLKDKGELKYWYQSKSELNKYTEQYKKTEEMTSQRSYQHKEKASKGVEISGDEVNKYPLYFELRKIAG